MRALIARARQLFADRGYSDVSLAEIVAATGLTKGALYHHFPGGKEDLFRAVLNDVIRDVSNQIREAVDDEDPWTQLVVGCRTFLEASTEPGVHQILLIDAPSVLGWAMWQELDSATLMRGLVFTLTQLAIDGTLTDERVEPLAHLLSGAMNEAALWIAHSEDRERHLTETSTTLTALLESYRDGERTVASKGTLSPQWSPSRIGTWFGQGSGRWWFDPGSLSLDFAHAGSMPEAPEQWSTTADLKDWVERRFEGNFRVTKADLANAKGLREALAAVFVDRVHRRKMDPDAISVVNGFASGQAVVPQLGRASSPTFDQVLVAIAQDGVSSLTDHGPKLRRCRGCVAVYLDRTVRKTRQWCAWDRCALS